MWKERKNNIIKVFLVLWRPYRSNEENKNHQTKPGKSKGREVNGEDDDGTVAAAATAPAAAIVDSYDANIYIFVCTNEEGKRYTSIKMVYMVGVGVVDMCNHIHNITI